MEEELDAILKKITSRKAAILNKLPLKVWKKRKFDNVFLYNYGNTVYKQNTTEKWMKGCILLFPKKGNLGIIKNYKGITLTAIAAKVYNTLVLKCIQTEVEKILKKNQNAFQRN